MWPMPSGCSRTWPRRGRKTHDRRSAGPYLAVDLVCGRRRAADLAVPPQWRGIALPLVVRRLLEIPSALCGSGNAWRISVPPGPGDLAQLDPGDPAGGGATLGAGAEPGVPAWQRLEPGAAAAGPVGAGIPGGPGIARRALGAVAPHDRGGT